MQVRSICTHPLSVRPTVPKHILTSHRSPYLPQLQWYLLVVGVFGCTKCTWEFFRPKCVFPNGAFTPNDALGMLMIPLTVWGCVVCYENGFDGFTVGDDVCPSAMFFTGFFNCTIPAVFIGVIFLAMAGAKAGVVPQSFVDKITGQEEVNAKGSGIV